MIRKFIKWVESLWKERQRKKRYKKKLEELKKRDPFTYNH